MTVNREQSVCELPFISTALPESPHTASPPPTRYLMKYVQGKQRWGWCADLPPPWLTATCPVPLLIYKACRVSARVASLASLPRHKGTFITPCLHFNHQERSDNKKGAPISYSVQSLARHRRRRSVMVLINICKLRLKSTTYGGNELKTWQYVRFLCTYPAVSINQRRFYFCHTGLFKTIALKLALHSLQLQHCFSFSHSKHLGKNLHKKTYYWKRRDAEESSFSPGQVRMQWVSYAVYRSQQQNRDVWCTQYILLYVWNLLFSRRIVSCQFLPRR